MSVDKRKSPRYDVHLVVRYTSAADFVADYVENLSEGGLFVAGPVLPMGEEHDVEIVLPGQGTWTVRGRVVFVRTPEAAAKMERNPGVGMQVTTKPEGFDDALLGYLLRLGRRRDFTIMTANVPGDKVLERSGYQIVPLSDPASIARMAADNPQFAGVVVVADEVEAYRELLRGSGLTDRVFGVGKASEILDVIARIDSML